MREREEYCPMYKIKKITKGEGEKEREEKNIVLV